MEAVKYSVTERNNSLNEFRTPRELARKMAEIVEPYLLPLPYRPIYVLDPGANNGVLGTAVRQSLEESAYITGVDLMEMPHISPAYDVYLDGQDFLSPETLTDHTFDFIICNPPYTVNKQHTAELFVRKSLSLLGSGGWMVFLLRTNFVHSIQRIPLFKEFPPLYMYALTRRPSFYRQDARESTYGKSNTNAHDYSLFVWNGGYKGDTTLRWLDWNYDPKPKYKQLPLPEID